jgi:starch synthase
MRYGSIPIVARVGGLADTIIDANEMAIATGAATGFQFGPVNLGAALDAFDRAKNLWRDKSAWQRLQENGMGADVSWHRAARQYANLYRSLRSP